VIGGNGGHFWIQHPSLPKIFHAAEKKLFLQTCVIHTYNLYVSEEFAPSFPPPAWAP
jgi:hypothetical protein